MKNPNMSVTLSSKLSRSLKSQEKKKTHQVKSCQVVYVLSYKKSILTSILSKLLCPNLPSRYLAYIGSYRPCVYVATDTSFSCHKNSSKMLLNLPKMFVLVTVAIVKHYFFKKNYSLCATWRTNR